MLFSIKKNKRSFFFFDYSVLSVFSGWSLWNHNDEKNKNEKVIFIGSRFTMVLCARVSPNNIARNDLE